MKRMQDYAKQGELGTGILFQYINSIVNVLSGFLFYIYIIHFYNSELLGTVSLLLALVSLLNIVFSLGIGVGMQHFISYHMGRREHDLIKNMIKRFELLGGILGLTGAIFIYIASYPLANLFFHTYKYILLIKLSGVDLFFLLQSGILGSNLIGLQRFKTQAIWSVTGLILAYSTPIAFLIIFHALYWIVIGWSIGYAVSSLGFFINLERIRKNIKTVDEKFFDLSSLFIYSLPVFISSLIGYGATYVDRFIVSYLLNLSELGIYNFSLLMISAISFLIAPINSILLPKISYMYGENEHDKIRFTIAKGIEILAAIYLPLALITAALSSYILLLLANKSYEGGSLPIEIILTVSSIFVAGNVLSVGLQAIKKTKVFLYTSTSALFSNLILSFILIPRFQIVGASIGFSSISVVSFLLLYYFSKRFRILMIDLRKIGKIYLSGFSVFLLLYFIKGIVDYSVLHLFMLILLGFIIYVLLLRTLRAFRKDDLDFLFSILPEFFRKFELFTRKILLSG